MDRSNNELACSHRAAAKKAIFRILPIHNITLHAASCADLDCTVFVGASFVSNAYNASGSSYREPGKSPLVEAESLFSINCVHVLTVDPVVELLEIQQILVC